MRIAVIGAGPAGSRAAAGLSALGHEVHLYDKTFDREKPCGGGVPWRGLAAFERLAAALVDPGERQIAGVTGTVSGPDERVQEQGTPGGSHRLAQRGAIRGIEHAERAGESDANARTLPVSMCDSHPLDSRPALSAAGVRSIVFEQDDEDRAEVALPRPVAVFSRRALDRALAAEARRAGARLSDRAVSGVTAADGRWEIAFAGGETTLFDHVVGADGARSAVRRAVASPFAKADLSQAVGWYVPGRSSRAMTIRFDRRVAGYLWVFPRPDHLAIGACGPLAADGAETLWEAARALLRTLDLREEGLPRYSALIPSLGPDALRANRVSGPGWSLVGDAAGTVDPLTREGIAHAVRSADLLTDAFAGSRPDAYGDAWREAFLPEFAWAAARRERFFAPALTSRLVRYLRRSAAVRNVMVDLVLGEQDYRTLKARLLRAGVPAGIQLALSKLRARPVPAPVASGLRET